MDWSKFNEEVQKIMQEILRQTKGLMSADDGFIEYSDLLETPRITYNISVGKWTVGTYDCLVEHSDLSIAADAFVRMWQIKYKVEENF